MKKVFIGVLAALMLFAFTACEQPSNIWNPTSKEPTALNITQTGDFVAGQLFDPAKFSVEVVYANGEKETTSSANVVLVKSAGTTEKYLVPGDKVSATLNTNITTTTTIAVSEIDSIAIEAPATWEQNKAMKPSDISVVASYRTAAGVQTLALDPSEYTVEITTSGNVGSEATGNVKVWMATGTTTGDGLASGEFKTKLTEATDTAAKWDGTIDLRVKDGSTPVFYQRATFTDTEIGNVYEVVANMTDGSQVVLSSSVVSGYTAADLEYELETYYKAKDTKTTGERYPQADSVTLKVTYNYADEGGLLEPKTATIDVPLYEDYPTSLTAAVTPGKPGIDSNNPVTEGERFANSNFTVTGVWKSGVQGTDAVLSDSQFSLDPEIAPEVDADGEVEVDVAWTGAKYSNSAQPTTADVYVVAKAE